MVTFVPAWQTASVLSNDPSYQGDQISFVLSAIDSWSFLTQYTDDLIIQLPSSAIITSLTINNQSCEFEQLGDQLMIVGSYSFPNFVSITITRIANITYSLLRGNLPPGITVSSTGTVAGLIGELPGYDQITYDFTIRANNGSAIKDANFVLYAQPTPGLTTFTSLPSSTVNDTLNLTVYDFGSYNKGDLFLYTFNVKNSINVPLFPELIDYDPDNDSFIGGLPNGINLTNTIMSGYIDPNVEAGTYVFCLGFFDQTNNIYGTITVNDVVALDIYEPPSFLWLTPSGFLGQIYEGSPCHFSIQTDQSDVTFSLSPNSPGLPSGIGLSGNGDLEGTPNHVAVDTMYNFVVRGTLQNGDYEEELYSILIKNRYDSLETLTIEYRLSNLDTAPMYSAYASLISNPAIYRDAQDSNFGIVVNPSIYVIGGLKYLPELVGLDLNTGLVSDSNYEGTISLVLGNHTYAYKSDDNGNPIYAVVYRQVYDPLDKAGGFEFNTDFAIEEKVFDDVLSEYVYPLSIRNIRNDYALNIGFSTSNTAILNLLGPTGIENMPDWMRSKQSPTDTEPLGYVLCMPVAYVKLDYADLIISILNSSSALLPVGRVMTFNRYILLGNNLYGKGSTTFDNNSTTFDNTDTYFD